jgi:hypothetical protein
MKLLVITEGGRVVGTQPVTPLAADAPASAVLRSGPRQQATVVDVAVSGDLSIARKIDELHRLVARALRPAKAKAKRAKKKR